MPDIAQIEEAGRDERLISMLREEAASIAAKGLSHIPKRSVFPVVDSRSQIREAERKLDKYGTSQIREAEREFDKLRPYLTRGLSFFRLLPGR